MLSWYRLLATAPVLAAAAVSALAEKNQRMAVAAERQAQALEELAGHIERAADAHDELRQMAEKWIEKQEERYIRSLEGQLSAARKI